MAVPDGGFTSFHDLIVGHVTVQNSEIDDSIIVKSDGIPTYNFAVVVDDLTMEITHVIRGQDHVPNTPRQVLLYGFLGKQPPTLPTFPGARNGGRQVIRAARRRGCDSVWQ
jgi:glutamyl/glutaminyl-tRNA synthetase